MGSEIRFDDSETFDKDDDVVLTIVNAQQWMANTAYESGRSMSEDQRRNSSSLVVRLDFGGTSFLFTGDTNGREKGSTNETECDDQERFMVSSNDNANNPLHNALDCTVLKVPHHGSDGSSSLPFLKAASPEWVVISAGVYYEHPHSQVLDRLKHTTIGLDNAHILQTDDGEDNQSPATEENLGDDCYQFILDNQGIVRIEKWNVEVED